MEVPYKLSCCYWHNYTEKYIILDIVHIMVEVPY